MKKSILIAPMLFVSILFYCTRILAHENFSLPELNMSKAESITQIASSDNQYNWIQFNKSSTNKAYRAYGNPIPIEGYQSVSRENIKEIALKFISDNQKLLGIDKNNIEYVNAQNVNGKWYAHLRQVVDGLTVIFSNIELRINSKAEVFTYGVEYYDTDDIDTKSKISYHDAVSKEIAGFEKKNLVMSNTNSEKKFAFPIFKNGKYRLESVYKAEYKQDGANYLTFISAVSGNTLYRSNQNHEIKTNINVSTYIQEETTQSPIVKVPVENQIVRIAMKEYITDANGNIELDINQNFNTTIDFESPWVLFVNNSFNQGRIVQTINAGENNEIVWGDNNSEIRERMVVYHLNKIRNHFKSYDSQIKAMDFQLNLFFENDGSLNAYSSGREIHFTGMLDNSGNLAGTPSVLYHEYGHSINFLLYMELGQEQGMTNRTAHEALADINAAYFLDDPRVGLGSYPNPSQFLRNCKNNLKYPFDLEGESHSDGRILAGAIWDVRELVGLEEARKIVHFARYGLPDDDDLGVCFSEWLIEMLVSDDDDGNLMNGTPHYDEIIAAFDNHNIGFDILMNQSLVHNNQLQTSINSNVISIDGAIDTKYNLNKDELKLSLVYSSDNFKTSKTIEFTEFIQNQNLYKFNFNVEDEFGIISYYFNLLNATTNQTYDKVKTDDGKNTFVYEYGYAEKFREPMVKNNWKFVKQVEQGANWEIDQPEEFDYSMLGIPIKQTKDSDDEDVISLVTGSKINISDLFSSLPFGRLDAESPIIDLSSYENPVLKFESWMSKISFVEGSDLDLMVFLSSNGGSSWEEAFTTKGKESAQSTWEMNYIFIDDYVDLNNNFKYRVTLMPNNVFQQTQGAGFPTTFGEFQVDNISIIQPQEITSVENDLESNFFVNEDNNFIRVIAKDNSFIPNNISLYDIAGRKVNTNTTNNNGTNFSFEIDKSNLKSGIYLLEIIANNQAFTRKISIVN